MPDTPPFIPGDRVHSNTSVKCVVLTVKECSTTVDISQINPMFRCKPEPGDYIVSFERLPNGVQIPPMLAKTMVKVV